MEIKGLDGVINAAFVNKLARVSGDSTAASAASGKTKMQGQALYASLRSGARNFAAGVQLLNKSISFVNVSLDVNEKLLSIVGDLRKIVDKANRGNVSATSARQYRGDFDALTRKFDGILQGTKKSTTDVLDVTAMEGALVKSGLDQSKISELANMLRKITRPNDTVVDAQGNVTSDGNPIPLVDFQKSLRAAIFDEDDPTDDKSGFFARASAKLRQVESRLQTNVKAITQTRGLVKENLDLVRAAGLAFLDVSNAMSGSESVDQVTETIRAKIRSSAPGALAQAHNLEGVLVASLASLNGQTSGS